MAYQWNWSVLFSPVPSGETTYLFWLLEGLKWTVALSLLAWALALLVGCLMGALRTLPNRWLSGLATAHVELFLNVPLLVQLFIWYFVLPELLPGRVGTAFRQAHPLFQQFAAALLCLGLFTSARVAEQVRSGIECLLPGQRNAGLALGFTMSQTYRYVLLPMAFRIAVMPLTSEFLNLFKNSSVATTIGFIELSRQAQQLVSHTAQPYEAFIAATGFYLSINLAVMSLMRSLEQSMRVPGTLGGR